MLRKRSPQQALENTCMKKLAPLALSLLLVGCQQSAPTSPQPSRGVVTVQAGSNQVVVKNSGGADVRTDEAEVRVKAGGVEVNAGGGSVQVNSGGVEVDTDGADVTVDSGGIEVDTDGADVQVAVEPEMDVDAEFEQATADVEVDTDDSFEVNVGDSASVTIGDSVEVNTGGGVQVHTGNGGVRVRVPGVDVSGTVNIPKPGNPTVNIPDINIPQVNIPRVNLPEITLPGATVYRRGNRTVYALSGDVLFDFDKADLRPDAIATLEQVSRSLEQRHPGAVLRVEGHTDSKGSDGYNQTLSERRAVSVRNWLHDHSSFGSIEIQGFGESRPLAPNTGPNGEDSPQGRQLNRRVEITVPSE